MLRYEYRDLFVDVLKSIRRENEKKNLGQCKTYFWPLRHGNFLQTFFYISLPSLHDYDVKLPNCKFYGRRKQPTTNLFFSL